MCSPLPRSLPLTLHLFNPDLATLLERCPPLPPHVRCLMGPLATASLVCAPAIPPPPPPPAPAQEEESSQEVEKGDKSEKRARSEKSDKSERVRAKARKAATAAKKGGRAATKSVGKDSDKGPAGIKKRRGASQKLPRDAEPGAASQCDDLAEGAGLSGAAEGVGPTRASEQGQRKGRKKKVAAATAEDQSSASNTSDRVCEEWDPCRGATAVGRSWAGLDIGEEGGAQWSIGGQGGPTERGSEEDEDRAARWRTASASDRHSDDEDGAYKVDRWNETHSPDYSPFWGASPPLPSTPRSAVRRGREGAGEPRQQPLDTSPAFAARAGGVPAYESLLGQGPTCRVDKPVAADLHGSARQLPQASRARQSLTYHWQALGSPRDLRGEDAEADQLLSSPALPSDERAQGPGTGPATLVPMGRLNPLSGSGGSPEDRPARHGCLQPPDCVMLSGDPWRTGRARRRAVVSGKGTGQEHGAGGAGTGAGIGKLAHFGDTREKENSCGPRVKDPSGVRVKGAGVQGVCSSGKEGLSLSHSSESGLELLAAARDPLADLRQELDIERWGRLLRPVFGEKAAEKGSKPKARVPQCQVIDLCSP